MRGDLDAWIMARKGEGLWVQPCAAFCGAWFAQERKGRRSILCEKHRCHLWRAYRRIHGRAPPAWLLLKWKEELGNTPRKRYASPKRRADQTLVAESACDTGVAS